MGKPQLETSDVTNSTKRNSKQTIEKSNEYPEWLPGGWSVDFRTRKSGPNMGSGYKCYIAPSGNRFYSKPEVLRYLETVNSNSCTSKEEIRKSNDAVQKSAVEDLPSGTDVKIRKSGNGNKKDPAAVEKSRMEDLPPGTDVKTRKGGNSNKKDLVAVEKSRVEDLPPETTVVKIRKGGNGNKKDLAAVEKSEVEDSPPGTDVMIRKSDKGNKKDPDVVEKSSVEDLPPGWITEVKPRTGGNSKRKDRFFIDPESGYVFRSKKDALRYINSGDISTCVLKPHKRQIQDEVKVSPSSAGKKQKVNQSGTKRQLFVGQDVTMSSLMMVAPAPPGDSVVKNQLENATTYTPEIKKTSDQGDVQEKNQVLDVLQNASRRKNRNHNLSKTKDGNSDVKQIHLNSNKSSNKKEHHIPRRASKRLSGFQPEWMSNSISDERAPEYKSKKTKGEVKETFQPSDDQPAKEIADHTSVNGESLIKSRKPKVDEEVNDDDKSEPQQSFAFHYSWSDPCLEFAIQTLTGSLPVQDSVDNGPSKTPEPDMFAKNKLVKNVTGSSTDKSLHVSSKKSKNKKELTMPRRLSKRLAGNEPEVLPTERAIEYTIRKTSNSEPTATGILTNEVSGHVGTGEEPKLTVHASDRLETLCGESSSKSEKSNDGQAVPNGQLQSVKAENGDNTPQFPASYGDSWSDPCLEFAFNSLTGTLPVEVAAAAAADILPVMTFDINDPPNMELFDSMEQKGINEGVHDNSNQMKEFNTVCQPCEQVLDQPELKTCFTSYGNDPKFATSESKSVEDSSISRDFNGGSQRIGAGNIRQIDINTLIPPSDEKQVLEGASFADKPQLETINHDNSERAFCDSFIDSWSDPCLEFAFKTLTGAIPVEENTATQGRFQEPAKHPDQRDGGWTLPEFGFSSNSQSGIPFYNDMGEKANPGQQSSTSSSLFPQENPSEHGFSGVDPHKHYFQYSSNFQKR